MTKRLPKLKHHYETFPVLESERLILREIVPSDAQAMDAVVADPEMYRWWGAPLSNNEKSGERYIRRNLTRKPNTKPNSITWGIARKEDNVVIGEIFINSIEENRMAHIGYRVAAKWQNQGIAAEAAARVVKFCFEQTELMRLHTSVAAGNVASRRVLEKCGFMQEGFLRDAKFFKMWTDYYLYGLLRCDYEQNPEHSLDQ